MMSASQTTKEPQTYWKKLPGLLLWLALVGLALSNILLLRQNRELRAKLGNEKPNLVKRGDRLPAFNAPGLRGEMFSINYTGSGRRRVFLFFAPA
ncbi:MAG: hypothetical protein ACJ74G_10915 [Blastocatellia bacterium]